VDFINEKDGILCAEKAIVFGFVNDLADIFDPGIDGAENIKRAVHGIGYDLGQRSFSDTRGAPQNEGGEPARCNHFTNDCIVTHQVFLTNKLV
jgi:hypothetical protein